MNLNLRIVSKDKITKRVVVIERELDQLAQAHISHYHPSLEFQFVESSEALEAVKRIVKRKDPAILLEKDTLNAKPNCYECYPFSTHPCDQCVLTRDENLFDPDSDQCQECELNRCLQCWTPKEYRGQMTYIEATEVSAE